MSFLFELEAIVTHKGFALQERRQRFLVVVRRYIEEIGGISYVTYGCRLVDCARWSAEQRITFGPTLGLGLHEFLEGELIPWEDVPAEEVKT